MPHVVAVHRSTAHEFSKQPQDKIRLLEGIGVEGDAHAGVTVQHRSRVRADPSTPNVRQVHLIQSELFDDLAAQGHTVAPGDLGENITTRGIDLLALPVGTRLGLGVDAEVIVTGLRNPCSQIEAFQEGLLKRVLTTDGDGNPQRRAGVMGIVARTGEVRAGDEITVAMPPEPHHPLTRV